MQLFHSLKELDQAIMQVFKKMRHTALLFHWIFAVAVDQIPKVSSNLDV